MINTQYFISLTALLALAATCSTSAKNLQKLPVPDKAFKDAADKVQPTRYKKGLFWKIESTEGKVSYLLGTMHFGDARVLAIIPKVKKQFQLSSRFCTEVKLDKQTREQVRRVSLFQGSKRLKSVVDPILYKKVIELGAKYGLSEDRINRTKPWALAILFQKPIGYKAGGVDMELHRSAVKARKQLCALEDAKDQLNVFASMSMKMQTDMLAGIVLMHPFRKVMMDRLITVYVNRDLASMAGRFKTSKLLLMLSSKEQQQYMNNFVFRLIIRRNIVMVNNMLPYLRQGNTFFAVGALHLPGQMGMLQLLESLGYKVTLIY